MRQRYSIAAVIKNVSGECSTFDEILDCLIISTRPVTEIKEVSYRVICQTLPIPGNAYLITCGAIILIKILNLSMPKALAASN